MKPTQICRYCLSLLIVWLCSLSVLADGQAENIMVLDFELKDLTIYENNEQEIERTAKLKAMLEQALLDVGRSNIVEFNTQAQQQADLGQGYLYDHHDVVSQFGRDYNAQWVIVSRVHKPSYLFVYLKSQLIDVANQSVAGQFTVELKGQQDKFIKKGVHRLAVQIDEAIDHYSQ